MCRDAELCGRRGNRSLFPVNQRHPGGESAPVLQRGGAELPDDGFRRRYVGRNRRLYRAIRRIVVRGVALRLGFHEDVSEILDIGRELPHDSPIAEAVPCTAVVERPVGLAPRRLASPGAHRTDKCVGAVATESVKKRVIGGADGPAQVRLAGPSSSHRGEALRRPDQVTRIQRTRPREYRTRPENDLRRFPRAPAADA